MLNLLHPFFQIDFVYRKLWIYYNFVIAVHEFYRKFNRKTTELLFEKFSILLSCHLFHNELKKFVLIIFMNIFSQVSLNPISFLLQADLKIWPLFPKTLSPTPNHFLLYNFLFFHKIPGLICEKFDKTFRIFILMLQILFE